MKQTICAIKLCFLTVFFKKNLSVEIINKIIPYWIISRLLFPGEDNFFRPVAYRLCGAETFWCFSHVLWSAYCCRPELTFRQPCWRHYECSFWYFQGYDLTENFLNLQLLLCSALHPQPDISGECQVLGVRCRSVL